MGPSVFTQPAAGVGHNFADLEVAWGDFTVTPSVVAGRIRFTLTDAKGLCSSLKMVRSVIGDAIDQWLATNKAQLATNGVSVGNKPGLDTMGGSAGELVGGAGTGDGFLNIRWNKAAKYAETPAITTTSLTTAAITVSIPYADVV